MRYRNTEPAHILEILVARLSACNNVSKRVSSCKANARDILALNQPNSLVSSWVNPGAQALFNIKYFTKQFSQPVACQVEPMCRHVRGQQTVKCKDAKTSAQLTPTI